MEFSYLNKSSFVFNGTDMYQRFGIQLVGEPEDVIQPGLRSRKTTIPNRSGAYDFGARYYEERLLTLSCVTTRAVERAGVREISYLLSKKGTIRIWNEPDKYYIGRIYDAIALEQLRKIGNRFELRFVCEPFAYGATVQEEFGMRLELSGDNAYRGTASTPTRIEITNTGTRDAVGIRIMQVDRKAV